MANRTFRGSEQNAFNLHWFQSYPTPRFGGETPVARIGSMASLFFVMAPSVTESFTLEERMFRVDRWW
jgi:hypothetical protein